MLIWFVMLYLLASIGIGLYAATRVHNVKDYVVAGRHLPLYVVTATVFATWFGAETVLGISAKFVKDGLRGIVEDPFGASMCLMLVGMFFAARLYKLNLITIGDYYRARYGRTVEVLTSLAIILSYLGWVAAQILALGLVFSFVTQGAVSHHEGMVIGAAIVLGLHAVRRHVVGGDDGCFQMTIIVVAMLYLAWLLSGMAGGARR